MASLDVGSMLLHLKNEKLSYISHIPLKKPAEGNKYDVYDWVMFMINDDWDGSQSSKPEMK